MYSNQPTPTAASKKTTFWRCGTGRKVGARIVPAGARGRITEVVGRADLLGKYQTHYGKAVIVVWGQA